MTSVPPPLEWHPAYADRVDVLLDWLERRGAYADPWVVKVPMPSGSLRAMLRDEEVPVTADLTFRVMTLTRRRCVGLAPYVGRPFRYEWDAAVDELGRWVAGPDRIVHHDLYPWELP